MEVDMSEYQLDHMAVVCDLCTEEKKPARKTCIKCEMSMCLQHLEPHLTAPFLLQTHTLTEPIAPGLGGIGGATKCPHHGKILEYYCLDDLAIACMSCAIDDQHRLHNMKTLTKAYEELVEKLTEEQKVLANRGCHIRQLEEWDKKQRQKVESSSVRLIEGVSALRDIILTSIQSSVSARVGYIKSSKKTTETALAERDAFRFLQGYAAVHKAVEKARAVDLRMGLEPGDDQDKLVREIQQSGEKILEETTQLWSSLLVVVDPENHQGSEAYPGLPPTTPITFDPKSLGTGMSLSHDDTMVFCTPLVELTSHTLLCILSDSAANPRWVVRLPEDSDWIVGISNKNAVDHNFKSGHVYALRWEKDQLSFVCTQYYDTIRRSDGRTYEGEPSKAYVDSQLVCLSGQTEAQPETTIRPVELEVFWEKTSNPPCLSFYSRGKFHQRTELGRMKIVCPQSDLTPFVSLAGSHSEHYSQSEQKWVCPCGEVHYTNQIQRQNYYGEPQRGPLCKCDRVIGTPYMAVYCGLL